MEDKLEQLLQAGADSNRKQWASGQQKQGKKVLGVLCSYTPEEVIHAAGMLPWHVNGNLQVGTPLADTYFPTHICAYVTHVLESVLLGELDFLDGLVSTDWDDDRKHFVDWWKILKKD